MTRPYRIRKVGAAPVVEHLQELPEAIREPNLVPEGWRHGQLLNVRNRGDAYVITLLGEEFDPEHPERSMRFENPGDCQNFVSGWYAKQHHSPLAR